MIRKLILLSIVVLMLAIPASAVNYYELYSNTTLYPYVQNFYDVGVPFTIENFDNSAEHQAFCTAIGKGAVSSAPYSGYWTCEGADGSCGTYGSYQYGDYIVSAPNAYYGVAFARCNVANYPYKTYAVYRLDPTMLSANFTGSPTTGSAPLSVMFTVQNFTAVNASGISWSFGDGNITSGSTSSSITHLYQNQGIYTVIMNYYNTTGVQKSEQKNNYITVGAPNATKTKWFQTIDGTNGNIVLNSSIQLNDIENSSWVNATGLINDGMSSITTLEGHHINAYAQALGYSDADDLDILNDGLPAYIMMWPTFAKNVSEGNVSLYVTVKDKDTKANIKGAGVTMSPSSGSAQSTTTNEAGIAYFIVKNSTMVLITAQAIGQGYQTATTTINTGINSGGSASAAATILLGKNTVTPTFPTVTTLPGGGTPTATVTILPGCEDQISEEGQAKCRRAQSNQGLSFLSANMGDLIMLCVFVTMMYLLGFKFGK